MPREGNNLDERFHELLKAYIDGQLDATELAEAESALDKDPSLRHRLEQLRELSADVKRLPAAAGTHTFAKDFSARIVAEAQRRAIESNLPNGHHVRRAMEDRSEQSPRRRQTGWRLPATVAGGLAALAALLLLTIYLPTLFNAPDALIEPIAEQPDVQPELGPLEVEVAAVPTADATPAVKYVSDADSKILYSLVMDMQVSRAALDNKYLESVFKDCGVRLEEPIVATKEINEVLTEARTIVRPEDEGLENAYIYFLHADTAAVGRLMQIFYDDLQNVPLLRFDFAFETPTNRLMQKIAEASGKRFAVNESVAAPLAIDSSLRPSPFAGISAQGKLVSSVERKRPNTNAGGPNMGLAGQDMSFLLLIIRDPQ
ncbi:MAG: hypothetical protein R3C53_10020 [Pirellulaceae bacterium]